VGASLDGADPAAHDQTLKVWDLESGRVLATLAGHTHWVYACAVTPDGQRVVSASHDQTLSVWDLESGRAIATLAGHAGEVNACAVTPDGRRVVSASRDRTLRVWDLATYACLFTHRGDAPYRAVAAGTTRVVAGDSAGGIWFSTGFRPSAPPRSSVPEIARSSVPEISRTVSARIHRRDRPSRSTPSCFSRPIPPEPASSRSARKRVRSRRSSSAAATGIASSWRPGGRPSRSIYFASCASSSRPWCTSAVTGGRARSARAPRAEARVET
jgi:hypothetical protein